MTNPRAFSADGAVTRSSESAYASRAASSGLVGWLILAAIFGLVGMWSVPVFPAVGVVFWVLSAGSFAGYLHKEQQS